MLRRWIAGRLSVASWRQRTAPTPMRRLWRRLRRDFATIRISKASSPSFPAISRCFLALIPAVLMALAVVREKELGSITNLYVTPFGRLEFLVGKQIPYVGSASVNFCCLCLMAYLHFRRADQRQFYRAFCRRHDLSLHDDRLRHVGLVLLQHSDRGPFRHGHFNRSAGVHVRWHEVPVSSLTGCRRSWAAFFR